MTNTDKEQGREYAAHLTAELLRLKNRFDTIFNNVLCDMKPGWDDSIEGFNKAWDVARDIFQEEIGRAEGVARMAADLVAAGTYNDERDAIMSLVGKYPAVQICHLIDDARQAAAQEIVAKEMAAS